jgi:bacterioferritin-associated ferredoxin
MLVCLCRGVCDRKVRATIREGAKSCSEVGSACGAGTDCGACRPMIRKMLAEANSERHGASLPLVVADEAAPDAY